MRSRYEKPRPWLNLAVAFILAVIMIMLILILGV